MATTKATTSKTANTAGAKAGVKGRSGLAGVDIKLNLAEVRKEARKPLYAYVGAGDFAVERIKKLPDVYGEARANTRSAVNTAVKDYRSAVQHLPTTVKEIPTSLKTSLTGLSGKASEFYGDLSGKATEYYSDFVQRGERLVTSIRRQPSTKEAVSEAKTAARQTGTAATHARRSAGASKTAAESAASKVG